MSIVLYSLGDLVKFPRHRIPVLTYLKYAKFPIIGMAAPFSIKSRYAESAILEVTHADGVKVYNGDMPPNGVMSIRPRSTADMMFKVTLEPQLASSHLIDPVEHELILPVRQNPPRMRLGVPWFVRALENGRIGWRAPQATKVAMERDDGGEPWRTETNPITAFFHKFTKPGRTILRFIARDQHSLTAAIRTVWVLPPRAPRIKVENRVQCERPGRNVSFSWSVTHAEEVWLEELFRNERHKVGLVGSFVVQVCTFTEEFVLVARGPGGVRRMRLQAMPWIGLESPNQ
jgi:hypothetical protein